jgi:hypothetical protein
MISGLRSSARAKPVCPWHAHADQHGDQQQSAGACQPLGQRQRDEGIEAEGNLRGAGMLAPVDALSQPGQVGQGVRHGDPAQAQHQSGGDQAGRLAQVQRAASDRVEQEHRKQEVVHQDLGLLPHGAVEGGVAADEVAAEDEGKIREQELSEIHAPRIAATPMQAFRLRPAAAASLNIPGCPFFTSIQGKAS